MEEQQQELIHSHQKSMMIMKIMKKMLNQESQENQEEKHSNGQKYYTMI